MARPQQSEVARTAETDADPDHVETGLQGQPPPATGGETGPIPADNQPGHHPAKEQDKPDLDAFAAKLGAAPKASSTTKARKAAPQPAADPPQEREPVMVALAMLPLRETVKRLEHLEQTLSKRLMAKAGRGPRGR